MRNEGLSSVMPFTNRKLVDKVIRDEAIIYDVWRLTVSVGEGRDERLENAPGVSFKKSGRFQG